MATKTDFSRKIHLARMNYTVVSATERGSIGDFFYREGEMRYLVKASPTPNLLHILHDGDSYGAMTSLKVVREKVEMGVFEIVRKGDIFQEA